MRTRIRWGHALALLGALLWVGPAARAEEWPAAPAPQLSPAPPPPEGSPVADVYRPLGAVRVSVLSGIPDLFGLSASLTALRPLEIEVGGSTLVVGSSTYARAGVALPLVSGLDTLNRGWTLHLLAMAGYRYFATVPLDVVSVYQGATANTGLDAVYWFGPHLGLDLNLVVGGVYWFRSTNATDTRFIPDLRLSVGMAF